MQCQALWKVSTGGQATQSCTEAAGKQLSAKLRAQKRVNHVKESVNSMLGAMLVCFLALRCIFQNISIGGQIFEPLLKLSYEAQFWDL